MFSLIVFEYQGREPWKKWRDGSLIVRGAENARDALRTFSGGREEESLAFVLIAICLSRSGVQEQHHNCCSTHPVRDITETPTCGNTRLKCLMFETPYPLTVSTVQLVTFWNCDIVICIFFAGGALLWLRFAPTLHEQTISFWKGMRSSLNTRVAEVRVIGQLF